MTSQLSITHQGEHFKATNLGNLSNLHQYKLSIPILSEPVSGKVFLKEGLDLTSMEVSINTLPAGVSMPFWHRHRENEELYIFIGGRGRFMVDDQCFDVQEGSVVAVQPEAKRTWRSDGPGELVYVVIQAKKDSLAQHSIEDGIGISDPVIWPNS